jgi:small subunit ribosomal protein S2
MAFPTIQDLLEAGVHFGHQTSRWNPKMKKFIFTERNGIHIIDLKKTLFQLKRACDLVNNIVERGGSVLFVGTKRQLREVIREEAERCGMFYVNDRWLGGMMTNFQTIKKNIRRLRELERMKEEGEFELRTKKEGLSLERELIKLQKILDGIKHMGDIPKAIVVVDALKEKIAVAEANKLNIPLIALMDTNADPEKATVPIAGNDDAIRSVKLVTQAIAEAVLEGKAKIPEKPAAKQVQDSTRRGQEKKKVSAGETSDSKKQDQPKRSRPRRRPRKKKPVDGREAGRTENTSSKE